MSKAEKRKNDKFLVFIKKYNVRHLEATRYKADLGSDAIDITGFEDIKSRPAIKKKIVEVFSKLKDENRAKWMFRELKF
jgi:large subunit ribosomal protein L27e